MNKTLVTTLSALALITAVSVPVLAETTGNMPMMGAQMPMGQKGNMQMMHGGGMMNPEMMQQKQAMMQQHMATMETHLANIEALLKELVELQKKK